MSFKIVSMVVFTKFAAMVEKCFCVFNASHLILTCLGMVYMYVNEKVQVNRAKEIICIDFCNCPLLQKS
jgi:hypothetical protein